MVQFQISAPASISLFGEHVKNTLRTSIDLRTTLNFKEFPIGHSNNIEISFPEIELIVTLPLENFRQFYDNCVENRILLNIEMLLLEGLISSYDQRKFLQIFCYLSVCIIYEEQIEKKPFSIIVATQLIFNEKFISLASLKVCIAACFLRWSRLQKGIQYNSDVTDLNKICTYAMRCKDTEKTSALDMIDIIVCTYGTIIRYEIEPNNHRLFRLPKLAILLVDSKQTPDVEARHQRVTKLMNECPELASLIINGIGDVTNMVTDTFQRIFEIYKNKELSIIMKKEGFSPQFKTLEKLTYLCQSLLQTLDVSNNHLDEICRIAQKHGLSGKYTDFGNGRCAYIWCSPSINETDIISFTNELRMCGFNVILTVLGTKVKIQ